MSAVNTQREYLQNFGENMIVILTRVSEKKKEEEEKRR